MLISGVESDLEVGDQRVPEVRGSIDHQEEFRTAHELFELMTNNCGYDVSDGEALTTQDLVLLYQNIDIGTKLMNSANEARRPNQYVETIVYNDDPDSDSDISDDDLPNVFKINQERMDFFSNVSIENVLSHKLGGLEIQMSDLTSQYDRQFYKDPFIKDQLKNIFDIDCNDLKTVLPTSLLDFICCKRLEDNYNFYMDNIINYVQRTIEQLKRISNGDYLTDRTKEKWREVTVKCCQDISTFSSACIPLHIGNKNESVTNWNNMVHSAIDVRSLTKILKKKVVVEIPKLISGSFRVFGKQYADNLVISCKRDKKVKQKNGTENDDTRLDVVLQVKRSETGQITTRVSSIILQMPSDIPTQDSPAQEILPLPSTSNVLSLPYKEENETDCDATTTFTMSNVGTNDTNTDTNKEASDPVVITGEVDRGSFEDGSNVETTCTDSDCFGFYDVTANELQSGSSNDQKCEDIQTAVTETVSRDNLETPFNLISADELRITMHRLNIQTALPEESTEDITRPIRKKSPPKRIKSPYENKLFLMEEKKRKKLLEIRERREKRKQALSENCKVTKNKCGKIYTAQPSSSVTKLSITNKSFYNSIYGQNFNLDKSNKGKPRKPNKKDNPMAIDVSIVEIENIYESPNVTPERYGKQYINRSYYLDEAETAVDAQMKQSENNKQTCSASTSTINNDYHNSIDLFHQLIEPSLNNLEEVPSLSCEDIAHNNSDSLIPESININDDSELPEASIEKGQHIAKETIKDTHESSPAPSITLECRKSIEKLYDLMRKSKKPNKADFKNSTTKLNITKPETFNNCTVQSASSRTSLRNNFEESPSLSNLEQIDDKKLRTNYRIGPSSPVVPKVIISAKHEIKPDTDKIKKDRKKLNHPVVTKVIPENPLRAISQLLQEFDHVQKTRQRFVPDNKGLKKGEIVSNEGRNSNRPFRDIKSPRRRSRIDQHTRDIVQDPAKSFHLRERRRPVPLLETPNNQRPVEEKIIERNNIVKKKIMDIIEEAKEARGEAIRGPSKPHSRLNTLAQPKKAYVQAHSEDYQNKYGRNLIADRLQRLAGSVSKSDRYIGSVNSRLRARRNGGDTISNDESIKAVSAPPPLQNTEKHFRTVPPNHISAIPHRSSPRKPPRTPVQLIGGIPMGSPQQSPARSIRSLARSPHFSPHTSPLSTPQSRKSPTRKTAPETCMGSIPESPEVRNKMVAVESYVKSHYGVRLQSPKSNQLLPTGHISRVPLVPKDMTVLTSSSNAGEANELGSALHSMIKSMIDTNLPPNADNNIDYTDHLSISGIQTDSDFKMDVEDKNNIEADTENLTDAKQSDNVTAAEGSQSEKYELKPLCSKTELEKLENALHNQYNQMPGAFQKRLRIKNLTLTPKQSLQKVYLLQSGDAGSLLVKSLTKIKINNCDENDEIKLPIMINNDFKFDFMQIPPQQRTVGFAVTNHSAGKRKPLSSIMSESDQIVSSIDSNSMADKVIQCYKGVSEDQRQENSVQVENEIPNMTSVSVDFNKTVNDTPSVGTSKDITGSDQAGLPKKDRCKKEKVFKNRNIKDTKDNARDEDLEDDYLVKDSDVISMVETSTMDITEACDKTSKCAVSEKSTNAEYTSSLDVLVGLLNEIQKITNQTHLRDSSSDLNTILTEAAAKEKVTSSKEPRVVSSMEKIKKLDSKPSIYSLYISAKDCVYSSSHHDINIEMNKSVYIDKEVNVNVEKNMVTTFTDTSRIFPITINHSTTITNSLIGVLSEPSSQSLYSFDDYQSLCSNKILDSQSMKHIAEISQKGVENKDTIPAINAFETSKITPITPTGALPVLPVNNDSKFKVNKLIENCKEFDPVLKIKRDILVTMYSILVFTVFAALSFPELVANM